jgi:hypothetical protein
VCEFDTFGDAGGGGMAGCCRRIVIRTERETMNENGCAPPSSPLDGEGAEGPSRGRTLAAAIAVTILLALAFASVSLASTLSLRDPPAARLASAGLPPVFHARVDAVCRRLVSRISSAVGNFHPHGDKLQKEIEGVELSEPIVKHFVSSLRKLGNPATSKREWRQLVDVEHSFATLLPDARVALAHRAARRLATIEREFIRLDREGERLALELGLQDCGASGESSGDGAFGDTSTDGAEVPGSGSGEGPSTGEGSVPAPSLGSSYEGSARNTTRELTAPLTLQNIQLDGEGTVTGEVAFQPPLYGSGTFTGTYADGAIEFTVATPSANPAGVTSETFTGEVEEGGELSGAYTAAVGEETQAGTWEVAPSVTDATLRPELARFVVLKPIAGVVTYRLPGRSAWKRLRQESLVPVGTEVDALGGTVTVTVASGATPAEESAELYEGEFVIQQEASTPYETVFVLSQPLTGCGTPTSAQAARKSTDKRRLWAHDTGGSFGTRGRYVSTTVEGTRWLTIDECESSFVEVSEGTVAVLDLLNHQTTTVHAGGSFRARKSAPSGPAHRQRPGSTKQPAQASGPLAAVEGYWEAIDAHDFARAYGYLIASAAGTTQAQFVASERDERVRSASFDGRLLGVHGSSATVGVVSLVTHDEQFSCRTWSGRYTMRRRASRWLIARAALTVKSCGR